MTDKLTIVSTAKLALSKAETLPEVLEVQRTAKAVRGAEKDTYSITDVKKGLSRALEARDRGLQAGAVELLAEYKAGCMLKSLLEGKAGDNSGRAFSQICRESDVNAEIAKWWKTLADEGLTEENLSRYVEHVQNSTDLADIRRGITLQGFRQFIDPMAPGAGGAKEVRHDWAVKLLSMSTVKGLDLLVRESCLGKNAQFKNDILEARNGVVSEGLPRDAEQERQKDKGSKQ
jgi:hypothetical protein